MSRSENKKKQAKKPLSKKAKVLILIAIWILLLGIGVGVAIFIKPEPEIVHTDAIIEAYKFTEPESKKIDTVDDVDYYGTYTPNSLAFEKMPDAYGNVYSIYGLKDKAVEETINNKIKEAATRLHDINPERNSVDMNITANYYNILSFYLSQYNDNTRNFDYEYLTLDLNTGDDITFDSLFSPGVNLTSILIKGVYDELSEQIQFSKLAAKRRLAELERGVCVQYCPGPGETHESLEQLIADYDAQAANAEEKATEILSQYLSGDKKFYLNSYGPALILSNGGIANIELKENVRYAVYLKNYRSADPIFEDNVLPELNNLFFTETQTSWTTYFIEETDRYLFDYAATDWGLSFEESPLALRQSFREYAKNRGLSTPGDAQKFRHILASGSVYTHEKFYTGRLELCLSETDKAYYDSIYRKAIIDGKTQLVFMGAQQPARSGRYNSEKVTQLPIDDSEAICKTINSIITTSGQVLENIEDILVNPPDSDKGWKEYLSSVAYQDACQNIYDKKCYTDEEKQSQELIYSLAYYDVSVRIKDDSESGSTYLANIGLSSIPEQYINPDVLIKSP